MAGGCWKWSTANNEQSVISFQLLSPLLRKEGQGESILSDCESLRLMRGMSLYPSYPSPYKGEEAFEGLMAESYLKFPACTKRACNSPYVLVTGNCGNSLGR